MKQDKLVVVCVLILLIAITAICAHHTVLAEKEREITEIRQIADAEINRLRYAIDGLQRSLQPKPYTKPLEAMWVSSGTGYRMPPLGGVDIDETLHRGIDLSAPEGTPVYSVVAGTVREHWYPPDGNRWQGHPIFGGMITIESPDGFYIIFGHLSATFVHENEWVEMGQIIGEVGNSGLSTASHLHLECVIEPISFLESR